MIVYGHWLHRRYAEALDLGVRGAWFNPDQLGDPAIVDELQQTCEAYPDFRFILNVYLTEGRLRDTDGAWARDISHTIAHLQQLGILHQCSAIQYDDEWWSALYTGGLGNHPVRREHWPSLRGLPHTVQWSYRHVAADLLGARSVQLDTIWHALSGQTAPPIGMAETGGCAPPHFDGQAWWGLNYYLKRGRAPQSLIDQLTRDAASTRLQIQPVIGIYADQEHTAASLVDLAAAHLPTLTGLQASGQLWSIGLFALHHPSQYSEGHGKGRGVLDGFGREYHEGVRWLCAQAAAGAYDPRQADRGEDMDASDFLFDRRQNLIGELADVEAQLARLADPSALIRVGSAFEWSSAVDRAKHGVLEPTIATSIVWADGEMGRLRHENATLREDRRLMSPAGRNRDRKAEDAGLVR